MQRYIQRKQDNVFLSRPSFIKELNQNEYLQKMQKLSKDKQKRRAKNKLASKMRKRNNSKYINYC